MNILAFVRTAVFAAAWIPLIAWGATPTSTVPGNEDSERYRMGCNDGVPEACFQFGIRAKWGADGVLKDLQEAARVFAKACEGKHAAACNEISNLYSSGEGVVKDLALSAALAHKACDGGYALACSGIGMTLEFGKGVAEDRASANRYYERACKLGHDQSCKYAQRTQLSWDGYYAAACDAGDADDCAALGNVLSNGNGEIGIDLARAAVAYGRACELGNSWSCDILGLAHVRGEGVPQDFVRAVQLFQQVCNDKTVAGCVNLGTMYWNGTGTGVPQDINRAGELNNQACLGGDPRGCDFVARASVAIMGTPEQQRAENEAQGRENEARGAEALQRGLVATMDDLSNHFEREARTRADADAMLARISSQTTSPNTERGTQSALSESPTLVAHPVAPSVPEDSESGGYASSRTSGSSGPVEMFVFFINLGGKTVAFEGPLALSRAEGNAMKARLEGAAPGRYGAGATVDARSRGDGWCAFVYQRPGDERYLMGSETTLSTATNSMKGMVKNLNAVIHHDVVCP